ncbi:MAG: hypothetical protein QOE19_242 [Actinomycetota bacterium]|nr:hypothetical protein [Actinomycetota bacterium]
MHEPRDAARRLTVIAQGRSARPHWEEIAAADDDLPLSQTPTWMDCVCASGRYADATTVYRTPEGGRLVLPLASRLIGGVPVGVLKSLPSGWDLGRDSGGLIREGGGRPTVDDVRAVVADLRRRTAVRIHVVPSHRDEAAWADAAEGLPGSTYRVHELDLSGGFDTVWKERFTSKARSNSRKAARRGVEVELDSSGRLIETFERLYRKSVERWAQQERLPVAISRHLSLRREPVDKFATVARALGDQCVVAMAWRAGEPVAGIIVLSKGRQATFWRGAMDKELAQSTGANELLHRTMIERACSAGQQAYDMGRSFRSDLSSFKEGFGAEAKFVTGYAAERVPLLVAEERLRRGVKTLLRSIPRGESHSAPQPLPVDHAAGDTA